MELYLVRHTRPDVPEGFCYGRRDVGLDAADLAACLPRIVAQLPRELPIYTSPATRCAQLAALLVRETGGSLIGADARLHELDFGDWEGRLWRELPMQETRRWTSDIVRETPPNGENFMAMWARVADFYQAAVRAALEQGTTRMAIVGHAGSLKVMLMQAMRLAPAQYAAFDLAQGRVSRLDVNRGPDGAPYEKVMFLNR
jgi:alpha-ribazole phosphatase